MDKISFTELSDILSKEAGLSKRAAHDIFSNLSAIIQEGLLRDGHVRLKGLGSFKRRKVADRRGINPRTRELIEIPEHYKIVFNPDKNIKEILNVKTPAYSNLETVVENTPPKKTTGRFNKYIVSGVAAVLLVFILFAIWPGDNESAPTTAPEAALAEVADFTDAVVSETTTIVEQIELEELESAAEINETEQEIEIATTTEIKETEVKYVIDKGDNLWAIAEKHYGNPYLWPLIYMANKPKTKNPDILLTGSEIHIPELTGTDENMAVEDTEKLALGNAYVYKVYHENEVLGALDYLTVAHTLDPGISEKVEFNETAKEILMTLARN